MEIKKYTGFTLIELLAVIVILAVIALIATPIIMNVINDSKEGAAKDAMYGYVKAVELASAKQISPTTDAPNGEYKTENGNLKQGSELLEIAFKGTKPVNGGTVTLSQGNVTSATLEFDGITVTYNGKKAEVGESGTPTPKPTEAPNYQVYEAGNEIYYNPETNTKCTAGEVNTADNAKTGCLKWNVITKGDTASKATLSIMLNHNTTGKVAWNSTGTNTEMKEVAVALTNDVSTWHNSIKNTARLIAGQELADIIGDSTWVAAGGHPMMLSGQSWLYQNLSMDNTNVQSSGYWTSTSNSVFANFVWSVDFDGRVGDAVCETADHMGIRPVITVAKSNI